MFNLERAEGVLLLIFNASKAVAEQEIITWSLLVCRQRVVGIKIY